MSWDYQHKPTPGTLIDWSNPLSQGLVGYWPMNANESSGDLIQDLSENGNTGTFQSTPIWVPGKFGPAVEFGVGDYILIANESNFDFEWSEPFSLSIWFTATAASDVTMLVTKQGDSAPFRGWALYLNPPGQGSEFTFELRNDNSPNLSVAVETQVGGFNAVGWTHVIVTSSGSGTVAGINIYVNAIDEALNTLTDTLAGNTILNNVQVQISGRDGSGSANLEGVVDNAKIWNRTLSASEVFEDFRNPFGMFDRDPIELWAAAQNRLTLKYHHYQIAAGAA